MEMDLVIPILADSKNNIELRYTLRSATKNLKFDNVFVVGDKIEWLQNIVYIPARNGSQNRAVNIKDNILAACNNENLSADFIFINDDYFFLEEMNNFPYLYKGNINDGMEAAQWGEYYNHLMSTKMALEEAGFDTLNYDVHYPIIYNKDKMVEVINKYNWDILYGYTMKSLYCNTLGIKGEKTEDCNAYTDEKWETWTAGKYMFSINERSWSSGLSEFLNKSFPDKSIYEQ